MRFGVFQELPWGPMVDWRSTTCAAMIVKLLVLCAVHSSDTDIPGQDVESIDSPMDYREGLKDHVNPSIPSSRSLRARIHVFPSVLLQSRGFKQITSELGQRLLGHSGYHCKWVHLEPHSTTTSLFQDTLADLRVYGHGQSELQRNCG